MATKKILKKIIKNWVEYYLPENWWWGGWDTDINEVNWLIDYKMKDCDSLFKTTSWLYKILNSIDDTDELWLTAWDTWEDIVSNDTSMSKISHCYAVMCNIASSEYAMSKILEDSSATDEISECWNSISIIAESVIANWMYIESDNWFLHLLNDEIVQNAFYTDEQVKNQIINDNILRIVNNNEYLEDYYQDTTIANAIANNSEALLIISSDIDKLTIIIDSTTITTAISNNANCRNIIAWDSDSLEVCKDNTAIMVGIATTSSVNSMSNSDFSDYILKDTTYLTSTTSSSYWRTKIWNMTSNELVDSLSFYCEVSWYLTFTSMINDSEVLYDLIEDTNCQKILNYNFNSLYELYTSDWILEVQSNKIPIVIKTNNTSSSTFYIPCYWYNWGSYNWSYTVDWNTWKNVSWSRTTTRIQFSLSAWIHKIIIKPNWSYSAWRARCFWNWASSDYFYTWTNYTFSVKTLPWYWFLSSSSSYWDYYMYWTFYWCNRISDIDKYITPKWLSITSIWNYFMGYLVYNSSNVFTWIKKWNLVLNTITSIWNYFMYYSFYGCQKFSKMPTWLNFWNISSVGQSFLYLTRYNCRALTGMPTWFQLPTGYNSSSYCVQTWYNCSSLSNSAPTENLVFKYTASNCFWSTPITPASPSTWTSVAIHRE